MNLIRELKSYWWGDNDRPKKTDDHALDELRYFVMTQPRPTKPIPPPKSQIQIDKERMMRDARRERIWMKN